MTPAATPVCCPGNLRTGERPARFPGRTQDLHFTPDKLHPTPRNPTPYDQQHCDGSAAKTFKKMSDQIVKVLVQEVVLSSSSSSDGELNSSFNDIMETVAHLILTPDI